MKLATGGGLAFNGAGELHTVPSVVGLGTAVDELRTAVTALMGGETAAAVHAALNAHIADYNACLLYTSPSPRDS